MVEETMSEHFLRDVAHRLGGVEASLQNLVDLHKNYQTRHDDLDVRVRLLEQTKAKLVGVAAGVGALAGILSRFILVQLGVS